MAKKRPSPPSPYSVHPSVAETIQWIATLKQRTGRSVDEWVALVERSGPAGERARTDWLMKQHGLGTNNAGWIAARSLGKGQEDDSPEAYMQCANRWVDIMFSGKRAPLLPLYGSLLELGLATGPDAKACPCRTMVPLYRHHVFAQIKPATNARLDLGLALGTMLKQGKAIPPRLIDTGGFAKKDRITHRIPITRADEIDKTVTRWLGIAYELDARQ